MAAKPAARPQRIEYAIDPPGPVLREYYADRSRVSLIMGPLGSAKTFTTCLKILRLMVDQAPNAQNVRPSRWVAIRNTYSDLETTTIKDWLSVCGDLGQYTAAYPPVHKIEFKLDDGTTVQSEMIFLALDRPDAVKKLRGMQTTGFWLNEAKELNKAVVDMADLRHGRFPSIADGGVRPTWHGMTGDTNAPDEDHWYYQLAEEADLPDWTFHRQPGGLLRDGEHFVENPDAENLGNLPDSYYLRGMQGKRKDWILVNLCNEYGFVQDGKPVWPEYVDSTHCATRDILPEPGAPLIVGIDFGLTPAAAICQEVDGQWRVIDELITEGMGAKRFGQLLKHKLDTEYRGFTVHCWGDPAGDGRSQSDESTPFQILRQVGINAEPAPSNDPTVRIEAVSSLMMRLSFMGKPAFMVSPRAKTIRKACAGGYKYRRLQVVGDERFTEVPDKNRFSHPADALQYACLGGGYSTEVVGTNDDNWDTPLDYSELDRGWI